MAKFCFLRKPNCQGLPTQQFPHVLALTPVWANSQLAEAQGNPRNLCSIGTKVVAQMPTDV